ncbi:MAG: alkyldihydroxyacetonephosphate synthase [Chloroflexota bacterium]|nr:alkyldihydroxyacetonephosphate synthase [Chloroflexota bacterium]
MTQPVDEVVVGLRSRLGADQVLDAPDVLAARSLDTWPLVLVQRAVGREPPPPRCVVRPRSTEEVAAALAYLTTHNVPVVPYGGGSGVQGGAAPGPGRAVVDVGALDRILALDEENLTVTVQSGVLLATLEAWLGKRGYTTGHYPQSIDLARIGGLVATRSSGQFSTRYGSIEDLVAGLEAVLPDGQVLRVASQPRRAVGPDLRQLWIGSEGAFGVITEVTLKVVPQPPERWLQAYGVGSMRAGLDVIRGFMRDGWRPAVVRLHDASEAHRSYFGTVEEGECILLLLSEGPEGSARAEGAAIDARARAAGLRTIGPEPVETWLRVRNDIAEYEAYIRRGVILDTIEVAAPWTNIADIYEQVLARLVDEVPEMVHATGHSSHSYPQGTNLYFVLGAQPRPDPDDVARVYEAIWSRVMETTLALGGTISHHHGVGRFRARWVPQDLGTSYELLRRVKAAIDPLGLMNPGSLLPAEPAPDTTKP